MARRKASPSRRPQRTGGAQRSESQSWLYGSHTVLAALANPRRRYARIMTCDRALAEQIAGMTLRQPHPPVEVVTRDVLDAALPGGAVHQGIAVLAAPLEVPALEDICEASRATAAAPIIVLDHVTDPHNIGAIVRSSAAFGAAAIVVHEHHTPPVTGVLAKAASGGLEHCPIVRVANLARALETIKHAGIWCIGLDSDASQSLAQAKVAGPVALVLGAEGSGLRRLTREHCDALAKIPAPGTVASLNVSNAAAIALYEVARERDAD